MAIFLQALAKVGGATFPKIRCVFVCALLLQQYLCWQAHAARKGEGEGELESLNQVEGEDRALESALGTSEAALLRAKKMCMLDFLSSSKTDKAFFVVTLGTTTADGNVKEVEDVSVDLNDLDCTAYDRFRVRAVKDDTTVLSTAFAPLADFFVGSVIDGGNVGFRLCVYQDDHGKTSCQQRVQGMLDYLASS
eukprot:TRINITY_DN7287_c0_g1_i1.p1 TRINITY_DN7287_c0_g1~~TRINITY_DN7287_c0_g1_i1.p1  ORF type:complete len:193 (-),score=39.75 TRINITY_DN7287_c0_g1_i1:291-869(-)